MDDAKPPLTPRKGGQRPAVQPVKRKGKAVPAAVAPSLTSAVPEPAIPAVLAAPKPRPARGKTIASPVSASDAQPSAVPPVLAAALAGPAPVTADTPVVEPAPVAPEPVSAPEPAPHPVRTEHKPEPVVATPAKQAVAPMASPAAKEVIMETIENVTAKTQTVFAEATERAKGAVEKSQKLFEDANEFGKGNIEALVESSKIAVRGFEALGQDAAAYAKKSFEDATAAAKTLTSVKSPTDFLKLHADYTRSAFDGLVQQTSRNTEALLKLAGEVAQPLSNRVALAAEKLKVVA